MGTLGATLTDGSNLTSGPVVQWEGSVSIELQRFTFY